MILKHRYFPATNTPTCQPGVLFYDFYKVFYNFQVILLEMLQKLHLWRRSYIVSWAKITLKIWLLWLISLHPMFRSSHPEVLLGKVVLKTCRKFTEEHTHRCSPVKLLHVFRTTFLKNTSEGLLLHVFLTIHQTEAPGMKYHMWCFARFGTICTI